MPAHWRSTASDAGCCSGTMPRVRPLVGRGSSFCIQYAFRGDEERLGVVGAGAAREEIADVARRGLYVIGYMASVATPDLVTAERFHRHSQGVSYGESNGGADASAFQIHGFQGVTFLTKS